MRTKLINEVYIEKKLFESLKQDTKTLKGHTGSVHSVAISPDGKYIVSGSSDDGYKSWDEESVFDCIKIWDLKSGTLLQTLDRRVFHVYSITISPDGKYIVSGGLDDNISIWDLKSGALLQTLNEDNHSINSVAISQDGKYIVSGSYDYEKSIKIWDLKSGELLQTLNGDIEATNSVAISPDGKHIVSGGEWNSISIWGLKSGVLLQTLNGDTNSFYRDSRVYVHSVAISPDGKYIVSGSSDKNIKIWNLKSGALLQTLNGHTNSVFSVAISPDGKYIVSGGDDNSIKIWDLKSGVLLQTLNGHTNSVTSVTFSPDGKYIVSGSGDKSIRIWDVMDITQVVDISEYLLSEDKQRADIAPYHEKMLEDTQQGHWSLWENSDDVKEGVKVTLSHPLIARDPKSSIVNGTVGIDFGTKSTVVVYQKETTQIQPMRVGTGDLGKVISASHYENPTIMEFNDLEQFMQDYASRDGRPFTKWEDLTISHTAYNNLLNSKSDFFNSYVGELKQWAGNKEKKLKIVDKKGFILDLPTFHEMDEEAVDPIEIYAYYLGLYINNHNNGIYLNYILSFPVTYEVKIRERLIQSFHKGLKKSLPQELHNQPDELEKLSVIQGASEPAAYAVVALQEYGFEPEGDEKVFYGVFDFGGGTTDFDFGIFREAAGKKERRYDYVIEHFGAGGDRYLGGENLLELLAFEVFKQNRESLLENKIQFIKPPETKDFLGSEQLLSLSREAKMNTKVMMETLRPFWENIEDQQEVFETGVINVNLLDVDAKQHVSFELDFNKDEMLEILKRRIDKGVKNFFHSLRLAFKNHQDILDEIEEINIFLAGNSSKSNILKELFDAQLEIENRTFKEELQTDKDVFKIYAPLDSGTEFDKPTGKTGVAFGLIETRKGGDILVIDHNIKDEDAEIQFKYYLGDSRKREFKVIINREVPYNKWIKFIDAREDTFEVFYSSQSIVTSNKIATSDNSIKKISLKIDSVDEDASVYIRLVSPNEFEYVVAFADDIDNEQYLGKINRVVL